jgi:hypothetical protein
MLKNGEAECAFRIYFCPKFQAPFHFEFKTQKSASAREIA